ncbi:MAG: type II toxin-antitoxin system HicB family antitoxin [Pseudomonadota bacterium]|nr:type II toxin-antitoxin system HicB family antitoxin [Pseudomonadota bacterium]
MKYWIECEREEDGRWLADMPTLPGVMAYGASEEEARTRVEALASNYSFDEQADE